MIRPLLDRVVIKQDEALEKTASGVIIPDSAKEKPKRGIVIAHGEGKPNANGIIIPLTVKVGDRVLYERYAGTQINVNGEELIIMKEADLFAVI